VTANRTGVLVAKGLAVLAVCGILLPEPIETGAEAGGLVWTWSNVLLGVGGLGLLLLVVRLATGAGWGPRGADRPVTPFGVEILGALALFFLAPGLVLTILAGATPFEGLALSLATILVANPLIVLGVVFLWKRAAWKGDGPSALGLPPRADAPVLRPAIRRETLARDLLWGAAFALALLWPLAGGTKLAGPVLDALGVVAELQPLVQRTVEEPSHGVVALTGFAVVVLAPLAEEFVFRGVLYTGLRRSFGPVLAAVASAAVFSAIHQSAYGAVALFGLGFGMALLYERSGSLASPIAVHAAFNAFQFVGIVLQRAEA